MTTTAAPVGNVENSSLPSSMFNIQYPNCRTGMFSLRQPFRNMKTEILPTEERQPSIRHLTPAAVQPIVPPNEEQPVEPIPPRQRSKRSAQVQCSLLPTKAHHDMAVQTQKDRQRAPVDYVPSDQDVKPRRRRQRKLSPLEQYQRVYEIWEVESPPLRAVPMDYTTRHKEVPRARQTRHRQPIIEYPDDEEIESDYDEEQIIYAHQPSRTVKKTYLPPNVRMICVRDDANRVSY